MLGSNGRGPTGGIATLGKSRRGTCHVLERLRKLKTSHGRDGPITIETLRSRRDPVTKGVHDPQRRMRLQLNQTRRAVRAHHRALREVDAG